MCFWLASLGAIAWNLITWYFGLPTSSSHALVGAYAGSALASYVWHFGPSSVANGAQGRRLDKDARFHRAIAADRNGARLYFLMVAVYWIFHRVSVAESTGCFASGSFFRPPRIHSGTAATTLRRRWA